MSTKKSQDDLINELAEKAAKVYDDSKDSSDIGYYFMLLCEKVQGIGNVSGADIREILQNLITNKE